MVRILFEYLPFRLPTESVCLTSSCLLISLFSLSLDEQPRPGVRVPHMHPRGLVRYLGMRTSAAVNACPALRRDRNPVASLIVPTCCSNEPPNCLLDNYNFRKMRCSVWPGPTRSVQGRKCMLCVCASECAVCRQSHSGEGEGNRGRPSKCVTCD